MKYALFILVSITLMVSCRYKKGSGNVIKQKRDTGSFTGVSAGGAFEVEIRTGNTIEVVVESDDNLLPYIETKVEDNILKINTKSKANLNNGHFKVYITAPELNYINGSGAAEIKVLDPLKSVDKIKVEASGAASVITGVDAPNVNAEASGASKIELSGRTKEYTAEADGSADIKSSALQSENATVEASGAASVHSHASISMNAKATGAATIYYRGGGALKSEVSGAGSVKQEN